MGGRDRGEKRRGRGSRTREMDLDVSRQGFVDGVDLLEGVDAVGCGLDVDDGVGEGDGLGEAGGCGVRMVTLG